MSNHDRSLLPGQRRKRVADYVAQQGGATSAELVEALGISPSTVHRDLERLAQTGAIQRVRGGALPGGRGLRIDPSRNDQRRRDVAALAVSTIASGQIVGIAHCDLARALAHEVALRNPARVVTNSPAAAEVFRRLDPQVLDLVVTPGVLTRSGGLVGRFAAEAMVGLELDRLFISADSASPARGVASNDVGQAEMMASMAAAAATITLVIRATAWEGHALLRFLPLSRVDFVVSDAPLPQTASTALAELGIVVRSAADCGLHPTVSVE